MTELLELQKLEAPQDEVSVCAVSWGSCDSGSCNKGSASTLLS